MTEKDKLGEVRIANITDREDGGANIEVDMDENVAVRMAHLGLEITFYCAAYKVDVQDVLDWISSHGLEESKDDLTPNDQPTPSDKDKEIERLREALKEAGDYLEAYKVNTQIDLGDASDMPFVDDTLKKIDAALEERG